MPTWRETLAFAKEAKELVQKSSILNPLARGAIKSIPIVGEILLDIWDISDGSSKNKSKQILQTLNTIERMNENTFLTFSQKMNDNKDEILKNQDKLNQILFETTLILDRINKLDKNVVVVDKKVSLVSEYVLQNQTKLDDVLKTQNLILNSLHIGKKISQEEITTKEHEEKIEILHREKERLSLELEKINKKPSIDITLTLREANFYYYAKKMDQAIKLYDIILKENPNDVDALNNKGLALSRLNKHEEAIEWYDKALIIDPKYIKSLNNKGLALYNLGKYQEAIEWYDKALIIDPKYVNTIYNKSCCCVLIGNIDKALFLLQNAISLDHAYRDMAKEDNDFLDLKKDERFKKLVYDS